MFIILLTLLIAGVMCVPVFLQMRSHPRGLHILFFAEMWERFSYYGMRALLIFYLTQHFLFSDGFSGSQYGAYTSLVYLMPLIGGYLADKYLGNRKAIAFGALLLVAGHLAMAVEGKPAVQTLETGGQTYAFEAEGRGDSRIVSLAVAGERCVLNGEIGGDIRCVITPNRDGDLVFTGLPAGADIPDAIAAADYELGVEGRNPFFVGVFYFALALIIMGVGFLKANISSIVGQLYEQGDPKRDPGFTLYYFGINLGSALATAFCGYLGETVGWWAGFGLAGIGMAFGWIIFVRRRILFFTAGEPQLPDHVGAPPEGVDLKSPVFLGLGRENLIYVCGLLGVVVTWFLVQSPPAVILDQLNTFTDATLGVIGLGANPHVHIALLLLIGSAVVIGYISLFMARQCTAEESHRLILAFILVAAATVFWTFFEQAGSSLNLFAGRNTQLGEGFFSMTASQTQSFNALFILLFAPIFSALWAWLGRLNLDPNSPLKFGLGLIQLGIGFFMLVWGANYADENFQVPLVFLALLYLFHTTGELCLSPVGLSAITKLSPGAVVSTMMAVWFLASAWAQYVGGIIASLAGTETVAGAALDSEASLNASVDVFAMLGWVAVAIGLGLSAASFLLKRLGHGRAGNVGPRAMTRVEAGGPAYDRGDTPKLSE
ncbi:MAG: oligopeptide:H+ symporter [Pseudomonadota bacterium]